MHFLKTKQVENVRKHRDIKPFTTERRRNFGVRTKLSQHNFFHRKYRKEKSVYKTVIHTHKKIVYLGLSILELCKILMYEFWYDYVKAKYGEKRKILSYGYRQFNCIHKN